MLISASTLITSPVGPAIVIHAIEATVPSYPSSGIAVQPSIGGKLTDSPAGFVC